VSRRERSSPQRKAYLIAWVALLAVVGPWGCWDNAPEPPVDSDRITGNCHAEVSLAGSEQYQGKMELRGADAVASGCGASAYRESVHIAPPAGRYLVALESTVAVHLLLRASLDDNPLCLEEVDCAVSETASSRIERALIDESDWPETVQRAELEVEISPATDAFMATIATEDPYTRADYYLIVTALD